MTRLMLSTLGLIGIIVAGWNYAPDSVREKAGAYIGSALSRNKEVVIESIKEKVISETPPEKRQKLITELKTNIRKTKEVLLAAAGGKKEGKEEIKEAAELLDNSEGVIEELVKINFEEGPKQKITERILDTVLPASAKECKQ